MFLVFQSIPYQQTKAVPTMIRAATVRSIEITKTWGNHPRMFSIVAMHGNHFATDYVSATTLDDAARLLRTADETGAFPATPPSDVETRLLAILKSGKRPTKTQLRKALNGY